MCGEAPVVFHFGFRGLLEVSMHETKDVVFIEDDLTPDICALEVEIEETMRFTTVEESRNFVWVTGG